MGREAICTIRKGGEAGEGRAHLDSAALELRSEVKARIPRGAITRHEVEDGTLRLWAGGEVYELELGPKEAAAWDRALSKPPPTLAEKLGIGPDKPAFILGQLGDAQAREALQGAVSEQPTTARHLIAELHSAGDLKAALSAANDHGLPIWCLYPKGKGAVPSDAEVRAAFRGAGWVDTKSCAVSDRLTGTRYQRRTVVSQFEIRWG